MRRVIITTNHFWKLWQSLGLNDDDIKELEDVLIKNPDTGSVIKSTGGLRKLRWKIKGKGKRGGLRIFYVDFPKYEKMYFISLLKKNEIADLSVEVKKAITKLIKEIEISLKDK
jgi:hypothetical protein